MEFRKAALLAREGMADTSQAFYREALGSAALKFYAVGMATIGALAGGVFHDRPILGTVLGFVAAPASALVLKVGAGYFRDEATDWRYPCLE